MSDRRCQFTAIAPTVSRAKIKKQMGGLLVRSQVDRRQDLDEAIARAKAINEKNPIREIPMLFGEGQLPSP